MHYLDKQHAKVNIAHELERRGWTLYGFQEDQSDSMTDYYQPARWEGVATKDGYTIVVDVNPYTVEAHSGKPQYETRHKDLGECDHCNGSGQEPGGWTLEEARANPRAWNEHDSPPGTLSMMPDIVSPVPFKDGREKCSKCGTSGRIYEAYASLVCTWPTFQVTPGRSNWHIEKGGKILAKGVGIGKCNIVNSHMEPYKSEQAANISALVDRMEKPLRSTPKAAAVPGPPQKDVAPVERVTVTYNEEKDGVEIRFPDKPAPEVLDELRDMGFRWHRAGKYWYAKQSPERLEFAQGLTG